MRHLKHINEYSSSDILYYKISEDEWSDYIIEKGIDFSSEAEQQIHKYVTPRYLNVKLVEYINNREYGPNQGKTITRLWLTTWHNYYIHIYQLEDEYFVLHFRNEEYKCDTIQGLIQFLRNNEDRF
jgi:hypothetical protein